mmetsp:Transcript_62425/g.97170  ORF Transcript_62425/g.97170 Transcript_62425/m.97170 type:complete len:157 (-) Transcript_62425:168-638(-)
MSSEQAALVRPLHCSKIALLPGGPWHCNDLARSHAVRNSPDVMAPAMSPPPEAYAGGVGGIMHRSSSPPSVTPSWHTRAEVVGCKPAGHTTVHVSPCIRYSLFSPDPSAQVAPASPSMPTIRQESVEVHETTVNAASGPTIAVMTRNVHRHATHNR